LDLSDERSTGIPYLAILAVNRSDLELLSVAEQMGSVRLFSSSKSYETNVEAVLVMDSAVYAFLQTEQDAAADQNIDVSAE
jgi:hypothetical protein